MKKIIRTEAHYRCDVCKTEYVKKHAAQRCESRPIEDRAFRRGDAVRAVERRSCFICRPKTYIARGKVSKVIGPVLMDEEYSKKWLGGRKLDMHVFRYVVTFVKPCYHSNKSALYYGIELRSL